MRVSYRKPSKYRAVPTAVDGIRFDSKREAARYQELRLLEKAGEIHNLALQPNFVLSAINPSGWGTMVGVYRADFEYCVCACPRPTCAMLERVVEDVKGIDTPLSKWKRRHVAAQYGIQVRLV